MKIVTMIARLLMGLLFLVFGLNRFLNFIPIAPMPPGAAEQFFGALISTHYIYFIAVIQIVSAVLLLINRYVPLGLTLLAPVLVNIDIFHFLMEPSGIPTACVLTVFWLLVAYRVRSAFAGLFQARMEG
jgi:putative oxidoreductase